MMDLLGAYTLKSLEIRILTYNYNVPPSTRDAIDVECMSVLDACVDDWLGLDYGFHSCSRQFDDEIQVGLFAMFLLTNYTV